MWSTAREIAAGDTVILWLTREALQPLVVEPGKEYNGRFGVYRHSDLVGIPYGSKVGSRNGKGFIHVLRPTPELWTMALPHRTQILYLADISFIVAWLSIKPGSCVIEAGTGSGSFTHSVARTIGAKGKLYSYEFHQARYNKALEEFERHGMSETVTLTHRNVCNDGFTIVDQADAVFLDLPAPWLAIEHAKHALRTDVLTRICCFSPCMEQVLRTVTSLNEAGFTDITTYETLLRPHDVHQLPPLATVDDISDKLKKAEEKREEKRLKQVAASRRARQAAEQRKGKRKRDGNDLQQLAPPQEEDTEQTVVSEEDPVNEPKKVRLGSGETAEDTIRQSLEAEAYMDIDSNPNPKEQPQDRGDSRTTTPPVTQKFALSKVTQEVRGHTSYLTFAVLLPAQAFTVIQKNGESPSNSFGTPEVEVTEEAKDTITVSD